MGNDSWEKKCREIVPEGDKRLTTKDLGFCMSIVHVCMYVSNETPCDKQITQC